MAQTAPVEMAGTLVQVSNGSLAKLGANKRVALTGCMVEYQTSVSAQDGGSMFNRNKTTTNNHLTAVPKAVLQAVTNQTCAGLREKLVKAGFSLVPDTEIKASPTYAPILAMSGIEGVLGSNSAPGSPLVFADATIPQYLPYIGEGAGIVSGPATIAGVNYEKALADAKPAPGGFEQSRRYGLPDLEVQLAKALNAHVLKAWTVVGFGGASASSERDWGAFRTSVNPAGGVTSHTSTNFKAEGNSLFSVVEHQTRLSVRLADGKPMGYAGMMERGAKIAPTDGDVVIKMAAPVLGGNSFFTVSKGTAPAATGVAGAAAGLGALFGGGGGGGLGTARGSASFDFETRISDSLAYGATAVIAIGAAHDGLVGLLAKP
jgi:hypothetical protein